VHSEVVGIRVNMVYNPLTIKTIWKMHARGGYDLGIGVENGPLMSEFPPRGTYSMLTPAVVNDNLHWSEHLRRQR